MSTEPRTSKELVADWIARAVGPRCKDYSHSCHACHVWRQFDATTRWPVAEPPAAPLDENDLSAQLAWLALQLGMQDHAKAAELVHRASVALRAADEPAAVHWMKRCEKLEDVITPRRDESGVEWRERVSEARRELGLTVKGSLEDGAAEPPSAAQFPRDNAGPNGWTIRFSFLKQVLEAADAQHDPWDLSLEQVEAVLLALETVNGAALTKTDLSEKKRDLSEVKRDLAERK